MLLEKIEIVEKRYDEIYQMISNPDIIADQKKYIQLNKELKELSKLVETGKLYKNAVSQKLEAEEYLNSSDDEDMTALAKEQLDLSKEAINNLEEEIKILLIPKIRKTLKMLLLKLEQVLVVMRLVFLQEIYIECIQSLLKIENGKLVLLILVREMMVDLKRSFLKYLDKMFTVFLNMNQVFIEFKESLKQRLKEECILLQQLLWFFQKLKNLMLRLI